MVCLYVFWLLMIDGIRPKARGRTRSFYFWKLGFGVVAVAACVLSFYFGGTTLGILQLHVDPGIGGYGRSELAGLRLMWDVFALFSCLWFAWFALVVHRTRRQLRPVQLSPNPCVSVCASVQS